MVLQYIYICIIFFLEIRFSFDSGGEMIFYLREILFVNSEVFHCICEQWKVEDIIDGYTLRCCRF